MKMRNLGTKLLGTVLAVCMMGSVFSANGIESRAATDDLPIDGFYEYDITAKKETRFTITIPEGNDVDMTMEGSAGTVSDEEESDTGIAPCAIIDEDNRVHVTDTKSLPNRWIAYIVSYWPDGTASRGTAWMYGPSVAMTAGHCIYNRSKHTYPSKIVLYPGYNDGTAPFGSYTAVKCSVPVNWRTSGEAKYDFGAVKLSSAYGSKRGFFGVKYKSKGTWKGQKVLITGYPGDKGKQLWRMAGNIVECTSSILSYTIDNYGGNSGSPIYYGTGTTRYSIGIHTMGSSVMNSGTRITRTVFYWMRRQRQAWG